MIGFTPISQAFTVRQPRSLYALQTKDDQLVASAQTILKEVPEADICLHYSIKWNYNGDHSKALKSLTHFLTELDKLGSKHRGSKLSVLLVSGGGKKKKLDTVKVLSDFTSSADPSSKISTLIVFVGFCSSTSTKSAQNCPLNTPPAVFAEIVAHFLC